MEEMGPAAVVAIVTRICPFVLICRNWQECSVPLAFIKCFCVLIALSVSNGQIARSAEPPAPQTLRAQVQQLIQGIWWLRVRHSGQQPA